MVIQKEKFPANLTELEDILLKKMVKCYLGIKSFHHEM